MPFLDTNGVRRLWTHVIQQLNRKVEKIDGKTLSSNDYTNEDKARVAAAASTTYVDEAINSISLSGALQFGGAVDALPEISEVGTVVLFGTKEYVYNTDGQWRELGDEGSHALKTITITAGSGLTGGGTLEANRTIAHSNVITAGTVKGGSGTLTAGSTFTVPSISYDANGHITSATTTTYTLPVGVNAGNITQTAGDTLILDCN